MKQIAQWLMCLVLAAGIVCLVGCGRSDRDFGGDGYRFDRRGATSMEQSSGQIAPDPKIVQIDNRFGPVRVEDTDGPLEWTWRLTVWADRPDTTARLVDLIEMRIDQDENRCRFTLVLPPPPAPGLRGVESNLTLKVPPSVKVALANGYGETHIHGIEGGTFARCRHGNLWLERLGGKIDAQTEFGDLRAEEISSARLRNRHGPTWVNGVEGDLDIDSQHGTVTVENVSGELTVNNRHGTVNVQEIAERGEIQTTFADIRIEGAGGGLHLRNEHGGIWGKRLVGCIDAANRHGSIDLEGDCTEVLCRNSHGEITLELTGENLRKVDAQTSFAELRVSVPGSLQPRIAAQANHGNVRSDFPVYMMDSGADGTHDPDASEPRIRLLNEHGNIQIMKSPD